MHWTLNENPYFRTSEVREEGRMKKTEVKKSRLVTPEKRRKKAFLMKRWKVGE